MVKTAILKNKIQKGWVPLVPPRSCGNIITCVYVDTNAKSHLGLPCEVLLVGLDLGLLLDLVEVQLRDGGVVAVDDLGELLEGGALGLDVHDVDEDELEGDPALRKREKWLVAVIFITLGR